ncbi:hypothetical protein M3I01_013420 [Marinomonas sp. RSW2]|uniref:Uncharacterized protein n=1 Tax=Marinomonas maritima TaxID=2940935 RepID=A0ABT5WGE9_9GAMM|nr:hypothetical protein [Marinomonas maritima]MDE8603897.1 hypothetical protein [Marinomonas maritima]
MSAFLLPLLRNLGTALLTKTFGVWLAKLAAKSTKTMVDDNAILLLEGGLNNNPAQIETAAKAILKEFSKKA